MGLNRDLGRVPEVLTVSGSNIGIGITSPSQKLDVSGSIKANNIITGLTSYDTNGLTIRNAANTSNLWSINKGAGDGSENWQFHNFARNSIDFSLNNSTGNLGIGTTSPNSRLHVNGVINSGISSTTQGQITLFSTTANAEGNIYGRTGGGMLINTNANAHPIEVGGSRIQFNSNVGIRNTASYSPLTVTGTSTSWGETATYYPAPSGYITLAFRLEGTDTTTGTWAFGKESSTGGNTSTQFLQIAKNGLTGSSLYRPDAVQAWNVNGDTSFGFRVLKPAQPSFLAHSTNSGFSVTAGTWINVSTSLSVELYDVGSNYSSGRFTAPVAGRYLFYAGGWSSINSNGERYAFSAIVNGGPLTFIGGGNYCLTDSPLSGYSIVYNLAAGDYVELQVFSAVGGTWGPGTHRVFWGGYLL